MYLLNPFHGRIGRSKWWLLQLAILGFAVVGMTFTILVFADLTAPTTSRNSSENTMLVLILAAMVYMNFSTCLNRLRDSGRNGLWYIAFLLPAAGTGLMIYFCGLEGGSGNNRFSCHSAHKFQPKDGFSTLERTDDAIVDSNASLNLVPRPQKSGHHAKRYSNY